MRDARVYCYGYLPAGHNHNGKSLILKELPDMDSNHE